MSLPRSMPKASPGNGRNDPGRRRGSTAQQLDRNGSPIQSYESRSLFTARLGSPVPSNLMANAEQRSVSASAADANTNNPLPRIPSGSIPRGEGRSGLAAAFQSRDRLSDSGSNTPANRYLSPQPSTGLLNGQQTEYGSIGTTRRESSARRQPIEDAEVVRRHLVSGAEDPEADSERGRSASAHGEPSNAGGSHSRAPNLDEFSSLQLQGGDMTRHVYKWAENAEQRSLRGARSKSFIMPRPQENDERLNIQSIKAPGGLRRDFLRRAVTAPQRSATGKRPGIADNRMFTNNFIEFLTLYGHFAGEELEDDDSGDEDEDYFGAGAHGNYDSEDDTEVDGDRPDRPLMTPKTPGGRRRKRPTQGDTSAWGATMLLLKSFVGTGVLFLPKAFANGGMLFSNLMLVFVAALSYYCMILLVQTRLVIEGSFGDIGHALYGKVMQRLILASIVFSQIGFVSAYIVFTSENLQAFILAVSKCKTFIDIKWMVLMQLIIFLPLSLVRDIGKLGLTALVADFFILLGLIYLYYYDIATIAANHGVSDIIQFNPQSWTLFIGTSIFTFEGIGLVIPIQESMRKPSQFPKVLAVVMIIITVIFVSMGALSYAAYGSDVRTVVLLNLPQDNKMVNTVQFLYSFAILLSTPLQLFPAIRILENAIFTRSGKSNIWVKWKKNVFRFFLVMGCALIAWGGASDLDKFVSLVGSFACVPLVYIYPPMLHLRGVAKGRLTRWSDMFLAGVGIIAMVYTTTLTIVGWASPSPPPPPGYCDNK